MNDAIRDDHLLLYMKLMCPSQEKTISFILDFPELPIVLCLRLRPAEIFSMSRLACLLISSSVSADTCTTQNLHLNLRVTGGGDRITVRTRRADCLL